MTRRAGCQCQCGVNDDVLCWLANDKNLHRAGVETESARHGTTWQFRLFFAFFLVGLDRSELALKLEQSNVDMCVIIVL